MENNKNLRWSFILVTMFLNTVGYSIIIPIIPFLVEKYVSDSQVAWYVGLLLSSYSFCQFFAAPGLGALSDRFGRKPILLISLFGSVIGYLFLGIGGSITILLVGRVIDGLTGGNVSTIYAYLADVTEPKSRGKFYGMLGAAAGFGFMIGPAIGGFLAKISLSTPLFVAAAVTFLNMVWGAMVLKESLHPDHKTNKLNLAHLNPFAQFNHVFSFSDLRRLFISAFTFFLAMNASYAVYGVYLKDVFKWGPTQIGLLLFFVGILDIISQGYLVQKLLHVYQENKVANIGLVLVGLGFAAGALVTVYPTLIFLAIAVIIINIGDGLYEPSFAGLISNAVDQKMQGRVQGASQSMQSITRVIGPLIGVWVFQYWKGLPFATESILVVISILLSYALLTKKAAKI